MPSPTLLMSVAERSQDRKSTRLNSSHCQISYAVFCLKKKNLHETAALYYCLALFIIGAQFFSVDLLVAMLAAHRVRGTDTYSIAEHTSPGSRSREHGS